MTRDLYAGHPARVATIECAPGARHQIVWNRGEVILENHDVSAELAMEALGGELPMCLELHRAYAAGIGDPHVLRSACTTPSARIDLIEMREEARRHPISPWVGLVGPATSSLSTAVRKARTAHSYWWWTAVVANLPMQLKRGFVVDTVAAIEDDWREGGEPRDFDYDELLRAQVTHPASVSLRSWVARDDLYGAVTVSTRLAKPGSGSVVTSWPTALEITLPLSWFADVWARGILGCIDDCFVVDLIEVRAPHELVVNAIRWQRTRGTVEPVVAPAIARLSSHGWTLVWAGS